jgi:Na+/H+ antiporter NhaC
MSKNVKTFIVLLISSVVWFGLLVQMNPYVLSNIEELMLLILPPIIISIIYYTTTKETKKEIEKKTKKEVKEQLKTLSEKYDVLKIYKGLAFLIMIAVTGFYIYSLVQFSDLPKEMRKMLENGMITTTVSYFISMFSLFCLTKIIDFLFDLDNQDKISSEKE